MEEAPGLVAAGAVRLTLWIRLAPIDTCTTGTFSGPFTVARFSGSHVQSAFAGHAPNPP
jgi:hypothetical protein